MQYLDNTSMETLQISHFVLTHQCANLFVYNIFDKLVPVQLDTTVFSTWPYAHENYSLQMEYLFLYTQYSAKPDR